MGAVGFQGRLQIAEVATYRGALMMGVCILHSASIMQEGHDCQRHSDLKIYAQIFAVTDLLRYALLCCRHSHHRPPAVARLAIVASSL